MQPSVSSLLKVSPVALRSAASRLAASRSASVVITLSIVARAGASMAAPFAIPPMAYDWPCRTASFGTVSVVLMASAAAAPPALSAAAAALSTAGSSRSIGSRCPIRPVEQTAISAAGQPAGPASRCAVSWVSA